MSDLNSIRANVYSSISEAERIYVNEVTRELFLAIQKLKTERDQALLAAINRIHSEFDEKIREVEQHYGFILVLSKKE